MIYEIHIPRLGITMDQATVVEWSVQDGQVVNKGDTVVIIETDKITHEIEAPESGFVKVIQPPGSVVQAGGIIGFITTTREEYEKAPMPSVAASTQEPAMSASSQPVVEPAQRTQTILNIKISGVARKMAEKHGLDLSTIRGTGPEGRITKEDVEQALRQTASLLSETPEKKDVRPRLREAIPLRGRKKVAANLLAESLRTMAQMTHWEDVDMSRLVELKESGALSGGDASGRITYGDIFVKFTALALKEFPLINASLEDDQIKLWEDINIGVAVAVGDDLVVPVIRNADRKSIREIAGELEGLAQKARENRFSLDDLTGGTITITNIGAFGANPGTPIAYLPQGAIVGFGTIMKKPVVVDDAITIRPIMLLSVTVDHRFITGVVSARFRQRLKALLEDPKQAVLDMV